MTHEKDICLETADINNLIKIVSLLEAHEL